MSSSFLPLHVGTSNEGNENKILNQFFLHVNLNLHQAMSIKSFSSFTMLLQIYWQSEERESPKDATIAWGKHQAPFY